MKTQDRLLVALDTPNLSEAVNIVQELDGLVTHFKIGLELLCAEGAPQVISTLHGAGAKLFFDGKFSDIPNTVAGATAAIARQHLFALDVHANCGEESVRSAVAKRGSSLVYVVSVLTSLSEQDCQSILGDSVSNKVTQYFELAVRTGAQGLVCSPTDLLFLKDHPHFGSIEIVTPGVRPKWAPAQDQKRVWTPSEALSHGATRLVIGRPILQPPKDVGSRRKAAEMILSEMSSICG